ncbi:hypothetical protein E2C01_078725 [Portunus trituberculatus]|uniref:Uncharacterized protein n=1 Tax=Portunus trituberculatus TaxID=210409 RepID=A0A5B7IHM1_PORTR|nr:hypothetical protein [Portunus trituberculatus]
MLHSPSGLLSLRNTPPPPQAPGSKQQAASPRP